MNKLVICLERGLVQQVYSKEPLELIVIDKSKTGAVGKEKQILGDDAIFTQGDTCVDSTVVDNAFEIMQKICGRCNKYIKNPTKFCIKCGQPLCDCDETIYCYNCISSGRCYQGCACGCGKCIVYYEYKECPYQDADRPPECRMGDNACKVRNNE